MSEESKFVTKAPKGGKLGTPSPAPSANVGDGGADFAPIVDTAAEVWSRGGEEVRIVVNEEKKGGK